MSGLQRDFDMDSLGALIGKPTLRWAAKLGVSEAELARRIADELARGVSYATQAAGLVLQTTTTAIVDLAVGCVTMYYVLLEWPRLPIRLENCSR